MREFRFSFSVCLAIIIASLVLGFSLVRTARIISDSIRLEGTTRLEKVLSELEQVKKGIDKINENIAHLKQGLSGEERVPELPGSKRVEGVTAGTNPIKGKPEAKILIVEFSDFQCPFTKRFHKQTFPKIEKEYVSTGKVKFAYRDLPLGFHPMAKPAAIACRCAGKQNNYWQMFDNLIQGSSLEKDAINKYAQELGLNLKAFKQCLDKPEIRQAVEDDLKDAARFGAQGTPSFFVNGRFIAGAFPFEEFKRIIEEELN